VSENADEKLSTSNSFPSNFRVFSDFWKVHGAFSQDCFKQTAKLALASLGHISLDGSKSKANTLEFNWINTVLGNLKTSLGGAYNAFNFAKYGTRYLGAFLIVSTSASILRRFLCVYSSLPQLSRFVRHVGFAKLKNLSNQFRFFADRTGK
jgi:hypothetical protein